MPVYGTFPYIPLLEGHAGKVYLTNNDSLALQYHTGRVGNVVGAQQALNNGVLAVGPGSDSAYQGRITIGYNGVNTRTELQYNGANWPASMSDNFMITPVLRDVSYVSMSNSFDIHQFTPFHKNPGDLDVYGERSGGSDYRVFVWALSTPRAQDITVAPQTIPADGGAHTLTLTLARRLHSSQAPTVSVVFSAGSITQTTPALPIKNADGQITGWTIGISAGTQPSVTANVNVTISELITYLKDDIITTETVTYLNNVTVGTLGIQAQSVASPMTIKGASLVAGSGVDPVPGYLRSSIINSTINNLGVIGTSNITFMGGLTARVQVVNGANWFGNATLIGKPVGTNNRTTLGSMGIENDVFTTLDKNGNTIYEKDFILNFNTYQSALDTYPAWDLGYSVQTETGEIVNWFGTYANGNLTSNLSAHTIYAKFGTDTYQGHFNGSSFVWDTPNVRPFKGLIHFYVAENWNVQVPTYIEYQVDALTPVPSTYTDTANFVNYVTGASEVARHFASLDTSSWSNGAHAINYDMYRVYASANNQLHQMTLTFSTDQGVVGPTPSYTVTNYGADPGSYDKYYNVALAWSIKASSVNQFTGTVAFSVTGLPSGTTAIFTPASGSLLSGQELPTTLTISAPSALVGTYPITVHAVSGSHDETVNLNLIVINTTPSGGGGGCVPAGTLYALPNGRTVKCEEIKVGEEVVAYDDKTLAPTTSKVKKLLAYNDRAIYEIVTHHGTLLCSGDHRLTMVQDGELAYPAAEHLKKGDVLFVLDGPNMVPSRIIKVADTGRRERVYHITLESGHVFVAGGFLAHNMKKAPTDSEINFL